MLLFCGASSELETSAVFAVGDFFRRGFGFERRTGEGEILSSESMERPFVIDDFVFGGESASTFNEERLTKLIDGFFVEKQAVLDLQDL